MVELRAFKRERWLYWKMRNINIWEISILTYTPFVKEKNFNYQLRFYSQLNCSVDLQNSIKHFVSFLLGLMELHSIKFACFCARNVLAFLKPWLVSGHLWIFYFGDLLLSLFLFLSLYSCLNRFLNFSKSLLLIVWCRLLRCDA